MEKKANDQTFMVNFYTSSNADGDNRAKNEREQFMCPLTNEIII